MFEFLMDAGTYNTRKVGRDNFDWGFVSTAKVSDGSQPYETAVEHEKYNDGEMVIVEAYDTMGDAKVGHAKWIKKMTSKRLPAQLTDCANSAISSLAGAIGGKMVFKRKKA